MTLNSISLFGSVEPEQYINQLKDLLLVSSSIQVCLSSDFIGKGWSDDSACSHSYITLLRPITNLPTVLTMTLVNP